MTRCKCEAPHEFRLTSENAGENHLYLRCGNCGGRAGRVSLDMEEFAEHVTNPNELDPHTPEVAETIVEHDVPTVSLHLKAGDSPFRFVEQADE